MWNSIKHRYERMTRTAEQNAAIRRMWKENTKDSLGLCAICSKCGGSYLNLCECAYQVFANSVTNKEIDEFLQLEAVRKEAPKIEDIYKKIESEPYIPINDRRGFAVTCDICPYCKGSSSALCNCRYQISDDKWNGFNSITGQLDRNSNLY